MESDTRSPSERRSPSETCCSPWRPTWRPWPSPPASGAREGRDSLSRLSRHSIALRTRATTPAADARATSRALGGPVGSGAWSYPAEVREAIAAGLLAEQGDRLGFRYDLVREAVDASLPKAVRRSMRRTAIDCYGEGHSAAQRVGKSGRSACPCCRTVLQTAARAS